MAIRRGPASPQGQTPSQIVFKPRASLTKFARFFPPIMAGLGAAFLLTIGIGYLTHFWLIPIMSAFPIFSIGGGMIYTNRLTQARVVIDPERLRIIQGGQIQANLTWGQIQRLTMRTEREDAVYEVWVKGQAVSLPAAFFEDGDKLLAAVSARSNRPWERIAGAM